MFVYVCVYGVKICIDGCNFRIRWIRKVKKGMGLLSRILRDKKVIIACIARQNITRSYKSIS